MPPPVVVTLSWAELDFAACVGVRRNVRNLARRSTQRHGMPATAPMWEHNIVGAVGEMTTSKYLDVYWNGVGLQDPAGDAGPVQVRSAAQDGRSLIVHHDDPDDKAFVLATGTGPSMTLHGFMVGSEAKRDEWWRDPTKHNRWAFFVPPDALTPMVELRPWLAVHARDWLKQHAHNTDVMHG